MSANIVARAGANARSLILLGWIEGTSCSEIGKNPEDESQKVECCSEITQKFVTVVLAEQNTIY
jgi:hypothetical protein